MANVLYTESIYTDEALEASVFGQDITITRRDVKSLKDVSDEDCAAADGLMLFRHFMAAADFERFPRLKAIVRMGVGYDRIDREVAAKRGVIVCNCPDYATAEVGDHAVALALALRKGLFLHHDAQRADPPAAWAPIQDPLFRRLSALTFGVVGLGRIGTTAALRAKAFGCRVVFYDPYLSNGVETALGIERAATLEDLLRQTDILSLHAPLTRETRGMIGASEIARLPKGAVIVNTARGPLIDIDAAGAALKSGHLAGLGLDVLPVEPPADPVPELVRAYRVREPWVTGRLVITPHAAFVSPEAYEDVKRKSAETMIAALFSKRPINVITPDME
ncbi:MULTISPECIES: C-terminal binding protein [unclassified Chelatococcus]|uniref:C-terminal binding protein n=1 Tax=unclassified Chelatococcus TaxID=2638111 RepID=UPI001BCF62BC|nr:MULTISPECIES: C-terminal binding protein [unclassified Chelatococcus]CAH1651278.1 C-terminal binding protein [Hyphomicrobiales bacterium]MBS7743194.1 C-terminal binding protein [Chelatococcus sp. HY11]MBX3541688.1 C-terminal binding protein [Chelatococcus sp.]MCO5074420.1 C-terminal binding protein [Chelatococcus sp.]CAH1693140.1 C-terminal binding protein [Hyphomicrobiales bacterium]